jgi:ATP-binding cassette subfamily B protein
MNIKSLATDSSAKQTANSLALHNYLKEIQRHWKATFPGLILPGIGTAFTTYVPPLIIAAAVMHFGNNTHLTLHEVLPYLLLFGGSWLLGEIIWRIAFYFVNRADAHVMECLYNEAMSELLQKDLAFFHNNFAGSLTKRALGYGRNFESFMDTFSFSVFANIIPLLFAVVVLWGYSPLLVLALLGLIAVVIAIVIPIINKRKKLTLAREQASNTMAGHVADIIGNIDAVEAFAHEDFEFKQHQKYVRDYMSKALRSWDYHNTRIDGTISPLYVLINVVGLSLALLASNNPSTIAVVFVSFNYFAQATRIMFEFNRIYRNLENAITEAGQFTELLLEKPIIQQKPNAKPLHITRGDIRFCNVDFAYGDSDESLFTNLDLHIKPGEKIALVGHSGSGKTTITRLLLRFNDITGGELLLDGQNIADGTLSSIRSAIAYVPQEPAMFHRSIKENIRYGQLDADGATIKSVAKLAHADEFITKLPHGYNTPVGERGVKLSGGQRQRIAIARAMIKNAPILVLDEATSALDSESEVLIQDALWKLMENRTAIVIAHRLSTIQKMDRIIVMDSGKIAEQGSHKELISRNGIYANLWAHQSGGFIEE